MVLIRLDGDMENFKKEISYYDINGDFSFSDFIDEQDVEENDNPISIILSYNVLDCNGVLLTKELMDLYYKELINVYPNRKLNIEVLHKDVCSTDVSLKYYKSLESVNNYVLNKFDREIAFSFEDTVGTVSLNTIVYATDKFNSIVSDINNARVDNKELSVFEKYMLVYDYVTGFNYNDSEVLLDSRNWMRVLTTGYITCAGYNDLLHALCNKLFTRDELFLFTNSFDVYNDDLNKKGSYLSSLIHIKDSKYNIDCFGYVDVCSDSKNKSVVSSCMPMQDLLCYKSKFKFTDLVSELYMSTKKEYNVTLNSISEFDTYINNLDKIKSFLPSLKECDVVPIFSVSDQEIKAIDDKNREILKENEKKIKDAIVDLFDNGKFPAMEAYVSALEVVGKVKGLSGSDLKEYVDDILSSSYKKIQEIFDVKKCKNVLANIR